MLPSVPLGNLDELILPGGPATPVSITGGCGREASRGPPGTVGLLLEPCPASSTTTAAPEKDRYGVSYGSEAAGQRETDPGPDVWRSDV